MHLLPRPMYTVHQPSVPVLYLLKYYLSPPVRGLESCILSKSPVLRQDGYQALERRDKPMRLAQRSMSSC